MDRPISSDEVGERFAEVMRDVADGESFLVTEAGLPIAKISPVVVALSREQREEQAAKIRRLAEELESRPITYTGPWTRDDLYEP